MSVWCERGDLVPWGNSKLEQSKDSDIDPQDMGAEERCG